MAPGWPTLTTGYVTGGTGYFYDLGVYVRQGITRAAEDLARVFERSSYGRALARQAAKDRARLREFAEKLARNAQAFETSRALSRLEDWQLAALDAEPPTLEFLGMGVVTLPRGGLGSRQCSSIGTRRRRARMRWNV